MVSGGHPLLLIGVSLQTDSSWLVWEGGGDCGTTGDGQWWDFGGVGGQLVTAEEHALQRSSRCQLSYHHSWWHSCCCLQQSLVAQASNLAWHISAAEEIAAWTPAGRTASMPLDLNPKVLRNGRHSPAMTEPLMPKMNGTVVTEEYLRLSCPCELLFVLGLLLVQLQGTAVLSGAMHWPWCVNGPWPVHREA
eukprot:3133793-Rhodomonas_salina.1